MDATLTVSTKTISPAKRRRLLNVAHDLTTPWEDVIAVAIMLREERDRMTWKLGDLCLVTCEATVGRPKAGDASRTISALAAAIGEDRAVLSALRANSQFYSAEMRDQFPPQISWRQASEARRRSGWQPETPITQVHRDRAMRFILRMEEDQDDPPAPPTQAERAENTIEQLKGIRFEHSEAAAMLTAAIETAERAAWLESGDGEPEGITEPAMEAILPVWSLADDTPWQYLARLTDEEKRDRAGVIILEGEAWKAYQKVRVQGIQGAVE